MKKILFLLCLLLGHIASAIADVYTLNASTLQNSTSVTATFSNGLSITNGGAKPLANKAAQTISSSATAYSTPSLESHREKQ